MSPQDKPETPGLSRRAYAKINLWLEVLEKRPDGYHEIRTLMQTVSLSDRLCFRPRTDGRIRLRADHPDLPAPEENLVVRAARRLQKLAGPCRGADIALQKRIPVGAGLGGGSSDCAATLRALNDLWGIRIPVEGLREVAAELGSDVPFFITGGTALCEGRGERISPVPAGGEFHYVLVLPSVSLSTAQVYELVRPCLTKNGCEISIVSIKCALATRNVELLGESLYNALQVPALELSPEVKRVAGIIESILPQPGCHGYSLSGSGSAFFLVCSGVQDAEDLAIQLRQEDLSAIVVTSVCFD